MTLAERLSEYVRAAFTGIYVRSIEHDDAIAEIARLCRDQGWSLATWDVDRGLALAGRPDGTDVLPGAADPLAAIRSLAALATPDGTAILVLRNFHRFLGSAEVVQALDSQVVAGKQARTFVVILSPVVQVPVELEKLFVVVEHDLPGRDQLGAIARSIATEPGELPDGDGLGGRARRRRRADPDRGRERVPPLAGPPRPARPRGPLGAQGGHAQEVGPADAAPGRRDLRRPRRPGGAQVVLLARPAARPTEPGSGPAACSCSGRRARARVGLLQGARAARRAGRR